jgi:hypothetical protein
MDTLRRVFVLTVVLFLVAVTGTWAQLPANELEGTWKMVKQERVYADSTVDYTDRWGPGFKILNSTHFAWGRETKDGSEVLAGGGWYEYHPEKKVYVEHIQYHSEPGLAGQTLKFTAKVDGDTWVHVGDLGDYKLREVWKRVDPETVRMEMAGRDSASGAEAGSDSQ